MDPVKAIVQLQQEEIGVRVRLDESEGATRRSLSTYSEQELKKSREAEISRMVAEEVAAKTPQSPGEDLTTLGTEMRELNAVEQSLLLEFIASRCPEAVVKRGETHARVEPKYIDRASLRAIRLHIDRIKGGQATPRDQEDTGIDLVCRSTVNSILTHSPPYQQNNNSVLSDYNSRALVLPPVHNTSVTTQHLWEQPLVNNSPGGRQRRLAVAQVLPRLGQVAQREVFTEASSYAPHSIVHQADGLATVDTSRLDDATLTQIENIVGAYHPELYMPQGYQGYGMSSVNHPHQPPAPQFAYPNYSGGDMGGSGTPKLQVGMGMGMGMGSEVRHMPQPPPMRRDTLTAPSTRHPSTSYTPRPPSDQGNHSGYDRRRSSIRSYTSTLHPPEHTELSVSERKELRDIKYGHRRDSEKKGGAKPGSRSWHAHRLSSALKSLRNHQDSAHLLQHFADYCRKIQPEVVKDRNVRLNEFSDVNLENAHIFAVRIQKCSEEHRPLPPIESAK